MTSLSGVHRLGARLGKTANLARRVPGYFPTGGASIGGTEAINDLIELHRRISRCFRELREPTATLLIAGGLDQPSLDV